MGRGVPRVHHRAVGHARLRRGFAQDRGGPSQECRVVRHPLPERVRDRAPEVVEVGFVPHLEDRHAPGHARGGVAHVGVPGLRPRRREELAHRTGVVGRVDRGPWQAVAGDAERLAAGRLDRADCVLDPVAAEGLALAGLFPRNVVAHPQRAQPPNQRRQRGRGIEPKTPVGDRRRRQHGNRALRQHDGRGCRLREPEPQPATALARHLELDPCRARRRGDGQSRHWGSGCILSRQRQGPAARPRPDADTHGVAQAHDAVRRQHRQGRAGRLRLRRQPCHADNQQHTQSNPARLHRAPHRLHPVVCENTQNCGRVPSRPRVTVFTHMA
ncbi:MAG: hypothetical protein BWZ02_01702 [Lentisphaerae bacterium ADurb.BinA184]|nr:MAG: hypothetical protein BWZ02_01702 [Lentisphaerae bacterium ADurb.BinA184]